MDDVVFSISYTVGYQTVEQIIPWAIFIFARGSSVLNCRNTF